MRLRPPVLVKPPTATPISVEEVLERGRVPSTVQTTLIQALIEAATARYDGYSGRLGRALVTQTWRQDFDAGRGPLRLRLPDVIEATAVWRDAGGVETPASIVSDNDAIGAFVHVTSGFRSGLLLRVTYQAGYGDPERVPAPIREAIHLWTQHLLDQSQGGALLRTETVEGVGSQGYFSPEEVADAMAKLADDLVRPYRWMNA